MKLALRAKESRGFTPQGVGNNHSSFLFLGGAASIVTFPNSSASWHWGSGDSARQPQASPTKGLAVVSEEPMTPANTDLTRRGFKLQYTAALLFEGNDHGTRPWPS